MLQDRAKERLAQIFEKAEAGTLEFGQLTKSEQADFIKFVKSSDLPKIDLWKPLWAVECFLPNSKIQEVGAFDSFFNEKVISFKELLKLQASQLPESQKTQTPPDENSKLFEELLKEKRKILDRRFKELSIADIRKTHPNIGSNILFTTLCLAYFYKFYNGEHFESPGDFLPDLLQICSPLAPQSKASFNSVQEIILALDTGLAAAKCPPLSAILTNEDIELVFASNYSVCEVLGMFFELLVDLKGNSEFHPKNSSSLFGLSAAEINLISKKVLFFISVVYQNSENYFKPMTVQLLTTISQVSQPLKSN